MKNLILGLSLIGSMSCAEREFSGSPATAKTAVKHSEAGNQKPAEVIGENAIPAPVPAPIPAAEPAPMPVPEPAPMPQEISESTVEQPSNTVLEGTMDKVIEFGSNEVYRIGNGKASGSSCLSTLDSYDLSGTTYYFDFEVQKDDTTIELSIGRICGIDVESNFLSLVKGGQPVQKTLTMPRRVVKDNGAPYVPYEVLKLGKGVYSIRIESTLDNEDRDNDDFIVGKIKVKADKDVKAVGVRTN